METSRMSVQKERGVTTSNGGRRAATIDKTGLNRGQQQKAGIS